MSIAAKRGTKETAHSAHRSPSHLATSEFKLGGTGFWVSLITAYRFGEQEFAELGVVNYLKSSARIQLTFKQLQFILCDPIWDFKNTPLFRAFLVL